MEIQIKDRIAEIEKEAEKNKVELTPEIKRYLQENISEIQEKMMEKVAIMEVDLHFLELVKAWIQLPLSHY